MPIAPPSLVVGAARAPLPYGLFSTFAVRPSGADRWESGVAFETGTCDPVDGIGAWNCEVQEVQRISVTGGTPTSGSYTLTYSGQTTATIAFNSNAALVQTRLEALNNIAPGDITVTGGPFPGSPITITFTAPGDKAAITAADTFNAGDVTVTEVTKGFMTQGLPKDTASNAGDVGSASPFTVYGHFSCSPVGYSLASAQDLATAHLLSREEARVEQALWTGDLGNAPKLADAAATTVTTAGTRADVAVGLLEDFIGDNYGSLGVVHMDRKLALALLKQGVLVTSGGRLTTALGTPVAAGAGYPGTGPTGQAATLPTGWAFVTPALFGYRSEVMPASSRPGDLFDRRQNNLFAVAERTYLLGFDPCGVGAAQIDLTL